MTAGPKVPSRPGVGKAGDPACSGRILDLWIGLGIRRRHDRQCAEMVRLSRRDAKDLPSYLTNPHKDPKQIAARAPEAVIFTTFDGDEHVLRALRQAQPVSCRRTPRPTTSWPRSGAWCAPGRYSPRGNTAPHRPRGQLGTGRAPYEGSRAPGPPEPTGTGDRRRGRRGQVGHGDQHGPVPQCADSEKHVSHILTTLDLNNRVQIALLVHDADLGDGPA